MIHPKKKVCACARVPCVRLLLVLVCRIMYHIRTYLSSAPKIRTPYTQNNISYFGGMYRKNKGVPGLELATYRHAHQKQACTLLYTCVACFFFSFLVGCCPLPYIKTNSSSWVYQKQHISSKRVYCYINKHTNRGHNLHGRVVGRKKIKKGHQLPGRK